MVQEIDDILNDARKEAAEAFNNYPLLGYDNWKLNLNADHCFVAFDLNSKISQFLIENNYGEVVTHDRLDIEYVVVDFKFALYDSLYDKIEHGDTRREISRIVHVATVFSDHFINYGLLLFTSTSRGLYDDDDDDVENNKSYIKNKLLKIESSCIRTNEANNMRI